MGDIATEKLRQKVSLHSPFLCETLERRGRGMDTIISFVGDGGKSKILVAEAT